ncbi:hypothetical protein [Streptomyces goshikiensis]|uniref:hypothetical protein n=1 Tax=Streptomyces goshikiensis TaxID=1942 RepID=UPI00369041E8
MAEAAGTNAWEGLRSRLARWFGRGDEARERAVLERLDGVAAELEAATGTEAVAPGAGEGATERVRARRAAVGEALIANLLEELEELDGLEDGGQRVRAAHQLRQLLDAPEESGQQGEEEAPVRSDGSGPVSGNTFNGPTAFQAGDHNRQDVRFGSRP